MARIIKFIKFSKIKVYFVVLSILLTAVSSWAAAGGQRTEVGRKIEGWVVQRVAYLLAGAAEPRHGRGGVVLLPDLYAREWATYLYLHALASERPELAASLDRLGEGWLQLLDPVWGGVYARTPQFEIAETLPGKTPGSVVASADSDYEKRLSDQAGALQVFTAAYTKTREARYLGAIERTDTYLLEWLADGQGLFFAGQRFAADPAAVLIAGRSGAAAYWQLTSEHQRRQFGLPVRAPEKPLRANAALATAYLMAARVTADPNHIALARRIAARLPAAGDSRGGDGENGFEAEAELLAMLATYTRPEVLIPDEIDVREPLPEGVAAFGLMLRSAGPEGPGRGLRGEPEGEFQAGGEG